MNLKSLFTSTLGARSSFPAPMLVVPGVSLIGLGLVVWLARDFFVFLISAGLVTFGCFFLVMAWRLRPPANQEAPLTADPRRPRIRVIEPDDAR